MVTTGVKVVVEEGTVMVATVTCVRDCAFTSYQPSGTGAFTFCAVEENEMPESKEQAQGN